MIFFLKNKIYLYKNKKIYINEFKKYLQKLNVYKITRK